jgi:hypothetical protein
MTQADSRDQGSLKSTKKEVEVSRQKTLAIGGDVNITWISRFTPLIQLGRGQTQ